MTNVRDAGFRNGIDVRVRLRRRGTSTDAAFDGAWWPRSRDLAVEVPELIAALDTMGVRVERFTYPVEPWLPVDRKVVVYGRTVRTGGFRNMDPQLVSLTLAEGSRRVDLLVVPPEAGALTGVRALRMSGVRDEQSSPQRVLAAAGSRPLPQVAPLPRVRVAG